MYTKSGLENGILNCRQNIKVLQKAIEDEKKTIADYRIMIDSIERSNTEVAEARKNIHVEVVDDLPS